MAVSTSAVIAGAAIVSALAAAGSTAYSVRQGEKQNKIQKREARKQQKAIDEENARSLSERKQKIDQMRMQMAGTGEGTRGVSSSGIKANVGGATANNVLG